MDAKMSRVRRKQVADIILEKELSIEDFAFSVLGESSFELGLKNNGESRFKAMEAGQKDKYLVTYTPGLYGRLSGRTITDSWHDTLKFVAYWIDAVKADEEAGDPWGFGESSGNEQIHIGNDNETRFSKEDVNFIEEKLDIVLEALKEFANDMSRIKEDLEYLKSSGSRVSKKDWGLMVMGNVMGWAMSNAIPKESVGDVWKIIVDNLENQNLIS